MRLKQDLILRHVADTWIVLPVGNATASFNGMISLNETGAFLWQNLLQGKNREELALAMMEEYNIDKVLAMNDIDAFLQQVKEAGCMED